MFPHLVVRFFGLGLAACLICASAEAQEPGRSAPVAIGPFLNGQFPSEAPYSVEMSNWKVEDAFALTLENTLTIVPNPDDERLYVGSRDGQVVSFENDPLVTQTQLFLDLRDRVAAVWDGGLLGLAFHPEFGTPGSPYQFTFFAYYSAYCPTTSDGQDIDFNNCNPGYAQGFSNGFFNTWLRLSRFTAEWNESLGLWQGIADSEEPMLNIRLYNGSHRGGGMVFGNDGYLYLTIGDQFKYTPAQDIFTNLEGGTHRFAVDVTEHEDGSWSCPTSSHLPLRKLEDISVNADEMSGRLYCIPDDNPFVDPAGDRFEEYFTLGHRNPHRLALDPLTGDLWSGEVGENAREEINILVKGGNYGWPFREGKITGPRPRPAEIQGVLTEPVIDFTRAEANAIIGGYVYRGSEFPELYGKYIAGDYVTKNVWALTLDKSTMSATKEFVTSFDPGALGTMGQDKQGNVFLGSVAEDIPLQRISRIGDPIPDPPALLSELGAFANIDTLTPHAAAVPFEVNPFWSDGASKNRWIFLPNDGEHDVASEQIVFSESGNWVFPPGTVMMKHFEIALDERFPALSMKPLETRFLILASSGQWYGVTYRWRDDGSEADLLATGATQSLVISDVQGVNRAQEWTYPSRTDCRSCHTRGAGGTLGPRTHGLNREMLYVDSGIVDNQLNTWRSLGMFSNAFDEGAESTFLSAATISDVTRSLEDRSRAFLDTNCSNCHRPETGNRAAFDARLTTPLVQQGLVWAGVIDDWNIADAYLVHPGAPDSSLIYLRANALGALAMPPLAKSRVQEQAMSVLYEWISRASSETTRSGLFFEYYETGTLAELPDFESLTPLLTGNVASFDMSSRLRDDNFAYRFSGYVTLPESGLWTFYTTSDDGSQLWIDENLVVDNDGLHGSQEESGAISLSAGAHRLVVTFFERGGNEVLNVNFEHASVPKRTLTGLTINEPVEILNEAPQLMPVLSQLAYVGEAFDLALLATDIDDDSLFFDAEGLPPGLSMNSGTGEVSGIPSSPGIFSTTLSVSDGPAVDFMSVDIEVREPDEQEPGTGGSSAMGGQGGALATGGSPSGGTTGSGGASSSGAADPGMAMGGSDPGEGMMGGATPSDPNGPSDQDAEGENGCGCKLSAASGNSSRLPFVLSVLLGGLTWRRRRSGQTAVRTA